MSIKEAIKRYKERVAKRILARLDGGAGSGNWGHVGVLGYKGGSAKGGGGAFRIEKTTYSKKERKEKIKEYTSQAKMRVETLANMKSKNPNIRERATKNSKRFNMNQKSVKTLSKFNPNASKEILADTKGKGRTVTNRTGFRGRGTKEAMQYTFPNTPKHKNKKTGETVTKYADKGKKKKGGKK